MREDIVRTLLEYRKEEIQTVLNSLDSEPIINAGAKILFNARADANPGSRLTSDDMFDAEDEAEKLLIHVRAMLTKNNS